MRGRCNTVTLKSATKHWRSNTPTVVETSTRPTLTVKLIGDGMMKISGRANATLSPHAIEQFSTKSCARCAGLLVTEWYHDLYNTDEHHIEILRCVQCGQRIDPVILHNQIRRPTERRSVRQVRHPYPVETGIHNHGPKKK